MHPRWRALWVLCVAGLTAFWLQTVWDMTHPPLYVSPWGPLHADNPVAPTVAGQP